MIGLIGAMAVEVEALEKKLEGRRETTIGMDTFVSGRTRYWRCAGRAR